MRTLFIFSTEKKLVPASKPDISQLSDTTVMLNWTVPQNDGLKITLFRVQYKEVAPTKGPWQTEERDLGKAARVYEVSGLKKGKQIFFIQPYGTIMQRSESTCKDISLYL